MAFVFGAAAQICYTGGAYTEDFNTLSSGVKFANYTNMPTGWVISHTSYVWSPVTNSFGYSNNYGTYCFSSFADDPDKSIGLVIGSTGPASLGAHFHNSTSIKLTSFSLSYFVKQWAKGAVTNQDQVIPFSYSLDATNLVSGTWVNVTALDMHSINDGNGVFAAMNGNDSSNRQAASATVFGISWLEDHDLWIRWSGVSHAFNLSHALAVDDLIFSAVPPIQVSKTSATRLQASWSTNYSGFALESASSLQSANWGAVTNVPAVVGSNYTINIDTTGTLRFFRLKTQ